MFECFQFPCVGSGEPAADPEGGLQFVVRSEGSTSSIPDFGFDVVGIVGETVFVIVGGNYCIGFAVRQFFRHGVSPLLVS